MRTGPAASGRWACCAPPACPFAVACMRRPQAKASLSSSLPSPPPLSPAAHTHDAVALCSRRSRRRHVWAASHAPPNQCRHTWARHARIKYSYSSSYYYVSRCAGQLFGHGRAGYSVASSSRRHTLACASVFFLGSIIAWSTPSSDECSGF